MIEAAERDGPAQAGRHDHRADVGQHRPRPRDRGRAQGLPLHLRHGRQAVRREAGAPARVRRRGRAVPDQRRAGVDPSSYYSVAARLARDIPGAFKPDQYWNAENPSAHERTTGPEIWAQTEGRITHLVASVGTGGTVSGTARYLKAQNPSIQVIGADPEGCDPVGRHRAPVPHRGRGRGLPPGHVRRVGRRPLGPRLGPRRVRDGPPDHARGGDPRRRVVRDGDARRARRVRAAHARRARHGRGRGPRRDPPRRRPELPLEAVQRRVDAGQRHAVRDRRHDAGRGAARAPGTTASRSPTWSSPARPTGSAWRSTLLQEFGISQLPVSEQPEGDALEGIVGSVSEKSLLDRAYPQPGRRRAHGRRGHGAAAAGDRRSRRPSTRRSRCCPGRRPRCSPCAATSRRGSSPSSTCSSSSPTATDGLRAGPRRGAIMAAHG